MSFDVFKQILQQLAQGDPLDDKFGNYKLTGNYAGTRECHIESDWLLIYEDHDNELTLIRTGTHSDLFGQQTAKQGRSSAHQVKAWNEA